MERLPELLQPPARCGMYTSESGGAPPLGVFRSRGRHSGSQALLSVILECVAFVYSILSSLVVSGEDGHSEAIGFSRPPGGCAERFKGSCESS